MLGVVMEEENVLSILSAKKLTKTLLFLYGKDALTLEEHYLIPIDSVHLILKTKDSKGLKQYWEDNYDAGAIDNAEQESNE
jgi:hypothetical protein